MVVTLYNKKRAVTCLFQVSARSFLCGVVQQPHLFIQPARLRLAAHGALGLLDEALGHVAADVARLTGGQVAVVALLEVDAQLAGDLVFHLVERALGLRHNRAVAAGAVLLRLLLLSAALLRVEARALVLVLILIQ